MGWDKMGLHQAGQNRTGRGRMGLEAMVMGTRNELELKGGGLECDRIG